MTKDINELTTVWYETPNNEEIAKLRAEIEQLQAAYESRGGEMNSMHEALAEAQKLNEILVVKIEQLQAESDISDGLLADARADNKQLKAAIAYVRQRSQRACEILNEFDNTCAALEPKP